MGYCTTSDIRLLTGLTTTQINDSNLNSLIDYATAQLNADINYTIEDEMVESISNEKENDVDGINKSYYVKATHKNKNELGDLDNDGTIDTGDVEAYTLDGDATRTIYTVSSIDDAGLGKFTLTSAPSSDETLYLRYAVAPLDESTPHQLIKTACIQLTAAFAFTRIDAAKLQKFKIGKIAIKSQTQGFQRLYSAYKETRKQINARMSAIGEAKDPIESIENV